MARIIRKPHRQRDYGSRNYANTGLPSPNEDPRLSSRSSVGASAVSPARFVQEVITPVATKKVEELRHEGGLNNTVLGTIPADYPNDGSRPTVLFDGEDSPSIKSFQYLGPYTPAAGHRVVLLAVGRTWIIIGNVLP